MRGTQCKRPSPTHCDTEAIYGRREPQRLALADHGERLPCGEATSGHRAGRELRARGAGHPGDWLEARAAIAGLPERQRLVLFLRHYADLDYHTIAEVAGIERGTVAAKIDAAHGKVRTAMTEVHR